MLILVVLWSVLIIEIVFVLWWLSKNNILLKVTTQTEGAEIIKTIRAREKKAKKYLMPDGTIRTKIPIKTQLLNILQPQNIQLVEGYVYLWVWDIFGLRPYEVRFGRENEIVTESAPVIGIKRTIKARREGSTITAYSVATDVPKGAEIKQNMMSWIAAQRHELYEETKQELSKSELFAKLAVPLGMVVLAMACLIFFPKIYTTIMEQGNSAASAVGKALSEKIAEMIPGG